VLGTTTDTSSLSFAQLQAQIAGLQTQINQLLNQHGAYNPGGAPPVVTYPGNTIPRTDELPSTATIGGVPAATTNTLTNYLPLTGGTVTGATSISDLLPLTAGTLTTGMVKNTIDLTHPSNDGLGFALGPDNFARMVFVSDSNPYDVLYARCTDIDCTAPVVTPIAPTTADWDNGNQMLAIGPDGFARMLFNAGGGPDADGYPHSALQLVRCSDNDCTSTTSTMIADGTFAPGGYGVQMTFGTDTFPRIAYANVYGDGDIHYVRCTDADCTNPVDTDTTAHTGGSSYPEVKLVLGQDHFARMVYEDGNDNKLYLLRCTNADCTTRAATTTIDGNAANDPGYYGSEVKLGSDGFLRIYYVDGTAPYATHYAVCTNIDCTSPTITQLPNIDGECPGRC
jgi:hypothetical protein